MSAAMKTFGLIGIVLVAALIYLSAYLGAYALFYVMLPLSFVALVVIVLLATGKVE